MATRNPAGRPRLFFFTTLNVRHGGYASACTLMARLGEHFRVVTWPITAGPPPERRAELEPLVEGIGDAGSFPELGRADHALVYLNDYPTIFTNFSRRWQQALAGADSVQLVFNRNTGGMSTEHWLAALVDRIYFHDSGMQRSWQGLTAGSPLGRVPTEVLAPPADLAAFRGLDRKRPAPPPVVVGRLAGDTDVPRNAVELYRRLAARLPDARFWFMPGPAELQDAFGDDQRFRFLARDAITPAAFLERCHIFALTYRRNVPIPGPRSLIEAMAAGCAPVVVDRDGPKDRIVHGESGFRSNAIEPFIEHVAALAQDDALRLRISAGAMARSRGWGPEAWVARILANSLGC